MGALCSGKSGQRQNANEPQNQQGEQAKTVQPNVQLAETKEKIDQNYQIQYQEGELEKQFKEIEEILNTLNKEITKLSTFLQEDVKNDNQQY